LGSTRDPTSPTPERRRRLALHLADLYTHRHTRARRQLRDVLDEGYWRPFREHGIRMQQLGENGADRNHLTQQFTLIRDDLAGRWRRSETAAKPGWDTMNCSAIRRAALDIAVASRATASNNA
jgi:hypothetical protein